MSESDHDATEPTITPSETASTEDERRAIAAEKNRKRTEADWDLKKKEWLKNNFPPPAPKK